MIRIKTPSLKGDFGVNFGFYKSHGAKLLLLHSAQDPTCERQE